MAMAGIILGPPVPYGNAIQSTALTNSFGNLPPLTKTVGANLLTNAGCLEWLCFFSEILAGQKEILCVTNVVSSEGLTSSVQS